VSAKAGGLDEGLQCVCVCVVVGGCHHIQITLGPSTGSRRGDVSGIPLPERGAMSRMFAQLGKDTHTFKSCVF